MRFTLNKTVKFSNAVKLIEDEQNKRFSLLNLNSKRQNQYLVFKSKEDFLLDYFKGTTIEELQLKTKKPIKEIRAIARDLKKNLFFRPVRFSDDIFPQQGQKNNYLSKLKNRLEKDLEDFRRKGNVEWSNYSPPSFAHITGIMMNTTNDCNLACKYCYAMANIRYDRRAGSDLHMPEVIMESTIDKMMGYVKHQFGGGGLSITFFGGQPSLKGKPRELLFRAVEHANKKALEEKVYLHFALVDNGTQIDDELIRFLKKYKIGFSLSVDLPFDVQDMHRPLRNGDKTSNLVESGLEKLIKNDLSPGIRVTLSKFNQSRIIESIVYLKKKGIHTAAFIPMEEAFSSVKRSELSPAEPEKLYEEYIKAYEFTKQLYYNEGYVFHLVPVTNMMATIMSGGLVQACGMGRSFLSVNTNGDIHTCQRVRTPEFFVANILDKQLFKKLDNISITKKSSTIYTPFLNKEKTCLDFSNCSFCKNDQTNSCANCDFLLFCAGGCTAMAWDQFRCRNVGATNLCDAGLPSEHKCFYTKKLLKKLFWEFIDLDKEDDKMFKYFASIAGIKRESWETVC